jgi:hypothetical protein
MTVQCTTELSGASIASRNSQQLGSGWGYKYSKEERPPELASLGKTQRLLRYNSPDMSGIHRTVRCDCGATVTSRQRSPVGAFNTRQKRAEVRLAHTGAPDIEQYMSGVHRTSRRAQKTEAPTVGIQRHW